MVPWFEGKANRSKPLFSTSHDIEIFGTYMVCDVFGFERSITALF